MKTRIHIVVDEADKERFRRRAQQEGKSLTAWLREAAREKLEAGGERTTIATADDLGAFFAACDRREKEREPDWEEHRRVIERSIRSGGGDT